MSSILGKNNLVLFCIYISVVMIGKSTHLTQFFVEKFELFTFKGYQAVPFPVLTTSIFAELVTSRSH